MKHCIIAGILCFLGWSGAAFAADLPSVPPPYVPLPPPPVYNWSGVYAGINGGYTFGDSNWGAPIATGNFHLDGGLVGGTIGANLQSGQFVFGVEADAGWTDINGNFTNNNTLVFVLGCTIGPCTYRTSNDWLATFRGRVGYALDRVLFYATAGGAAGNVKATFTDAAFGLTGSVDNTEFGWTAGAGVETALTENITAKFEYLYVDLANDSCNSAPICGAGIPVSFDASLIRAGLNFKFNPF
jgi:outer membrane immunogenic protein